MIYTYRFFSNSRFNQTDGFRCQITEVRGQNSDNREPQNTEQVIMNVEGKEKFIKLSALFRYPLARLPVKNKIRHCSFLTG